VEPALRTRLGRKGRLSAADRSALSSSKDSRLFRHDSRCFDGLAVRSLRLCFESDTVDRAIHVGNTGDLGDWPPLQIPSSTS
jgi:hypothetical protein